MKHIRVILAFLVLIPAFFALVLSAEMIEHRGKWTKQVADETTKQEKSAEEIEKVSKQHNQLLAQYDREMLGWDRFLPSVPVQVGDGQLTAGVGTGQRIAQNQTLFVFKDFGEQSAFVGPFRVAEVNANQSLLVPAWTLQPGEADQWAAPGAWRIRMQVPMANKTRFSQLQADLIVAGERLGSREKNLEIQDQLLKDAERDRDQRMMELAGGDPQAAEFSELLPQQFRDGLVKTLRDQEDARNSELSAVDDLRRRIKEAYEIFLSVSRENRERAAQLPGSELVAEEQVELPAEENSLEPQPAELP